MRVEGERDFQAPRATVWEVLNDPSRMAELLPGVESFEIEDDRRWQAHVKIPLGLGGLKMSIEFEKIEEREPELARLHAKGTGVGAIMNMDTSFELTENDDGSTHMQWTADVKIAGPVGSMGQRVLQPIINQQVGNVLGALDKQMMDAKGEVKPGSEPSTDIPPPKTDPQAQDAGPPAEGPAEPEGSSGAEEGLNPLAPQAYDADAEGPTTSTED